MSLLNIPIPDELCSVRLAIGDKTKDDVLDVTIQGEALGGSIGPLTGNVIPEKVDDLVERVAEHLPFDVSIPDELVEMYLIIGDQNKNDRADVTLGFEVGGDPGVKFTKDIDFATAMRIFARVVKAANEMIR